MPPAKPKAIDPEALYRIAIRKTITLPDGKRLIPRAGVTHKVRGRILEAIQSDVEHYEAV